MSDDLLKAGMAALRRGDRRTARRILGDLVREDPDNVAAWWFLAAALDDTEQKVHCLEQVIRLRPDHEEAHQMLHTLRRKVAWPTPPQGLERPVYEADEVDGGLVVRSEPESEAVEPPPRRRRTSDVTIMAVAVLIALVAMLATVLLVWSGLASAALGIRGPEELTPTLRPLLFDVQACTATGEDTATLIFINNTGLTVDILRGPQGEEEFLFTLSDGAQQSIETRPGVPVRYAVRSPDGSAAEGGAIIEVPPGNTCRVPIQ